MAEPGTVRAALVEKLAGLDSWETRAALALAEQVDESGSASAVRELRAMVALIEESIPKPKLGAVDVIAARRAQRAAG